MLKLSPVFENKHYVIEADFEQNLVRAQWNAVISEEELRAGALGLLDFLKESKLEYLLSNSQALASLSASTKDWLAEHYYEKLSDTNLIKLARVTPTNLFHQIALESVITRAAAKKDLHFEVKNFSREDEALRWLKE